MEKLINTPEEWIATISDSMDGTVVLMRDLYIAYIKEGGTPCTDRQFASAMRAAGFKSKHTRNGLAFTTEGGTEAENGK